MGYKVAILKSEAAFDHEPWVKACEENLKVDQHEVISIVDNDWYTRILNRSYDLFLLRPPGRTELYKRLYDERVFLISNIVKGKLYPSLQEVMIYENKRFLRDWLVLRYIPHPETFVFFDLSVALAFIENRDEFPVVAKTNIGASGDGVIVLSSKQMAVQYINAAFSEGIKQRSGPKLFKGSIIKKISKLGKKDFIKNRLKEYRVSAEESQKGYVLFQQFIPHEYEWRCVRIGDSFFAHKKIARNNVASGTLAKGYDEVPHSLLDYARDLTNRTGLSSVAIDLFENDTNQYLVNEIQCFFGQSDPYQMRVNGKPGRYRRNDKEWSFEEGMFNTNLSYDLRLEHALSILNDEAK